MLKLNQSLEGIGLHQLHLGNQYFNKSILKCTEKIFCESKQYEMLILFFM